MIATLRGADTARIRFRYSFNAVSATINSSTFTRVADKLAHGDLHVVEGRYNVNKLSYSAWDDSSVDMAANTFYLGNNARASRDFDALVVHESIHAWFDLTSREIPWVDNEAIAYIAQGYYLRNSGFPLSRIDFGEHFRTGYFIAESYINRVDPTSMIGDLRQNLLGDTRYSHYIRATFHGDG